MLLLLMLLLMLLFTAAYAYAAYSAAYVAAYAYVVYCCCIEYAVEKSINRGAVLQFRHSKRGQA